MILTILWARLMQKVTGPAMQAIGIAIAVAVVLAAIVGGAWWLRWDAARDRDRVWEAKMANARVAAQAVNVLRERKRQQVAIENAQEWAAALAEAEKARLEIETKLSARKRVVVYPKEIIPELNR
jgi:hypothetical protein